MGSYPVIGEVFPSPFPAYPKGDHGNESIRAAPSATSISIKYRRARSISIPQIFGRKRLVHYIGRGAKGKFGAMGFVEEKDYKGKNGYFDVLDFYVPKTFARCDKTSYRKFVASLKDEIFGNASRRMNREACEALFNNDFNFDLRKRSKMVIR